MGYYPAFISHLVENENLLNKSWRREAAEEKLTKVGFANDLIFHRFRIGHEMLVVFLSGLDQKVIRELELEPTHLNFCWKIAMHYIDLHPSHQVLVLFRKNYLRFTYLSIFPQNPVNQRLVDTFAQEFILRWR